LPLRIARRPVSGTALASATGMKLDQLAAWTAGTEGKRQPRRGAAWLLRCSVPGTGALGGSHRVEIFGQPGYLASPAAAPPGAETTPGGGPLPTTPWDPQLHTVMADRQLATNEEPSSTCASPTRTPPLRPRTSDDCSRRGCPPRSGSTGRHWNRSQHRRT